MCVALGGAWITRPSTIAGMTCILLTRSPEVRAEVCRLAAAAGIDPLVLSEPPEVLAEWNGADAVLVGADLAAEVVAVAPARRPGVHVVGVEPPDEVFRAAVALGAESVVDLPAASDWLVQLLSDVGEPDGGGRLLGVVGGAGGAGATTLACALAQGGATHGPTLLVDADPVGPGLDRLLGLDESPGIRWADLHGTSGRLSARALREMVPRRDELGVLTWAAGPRLLHGDTVRQTVAAASRGHELVVVDLPRHADDLTRELVSRCDRLVVVCRPTLVGLAATVRVVEALGIRGAAAGVVLRPGRVLADDVEAVIGLPVLAEVADRRGLTDALDVGLGPLAGRRGALARAVDRVLAA